MRKLNAHQIQAIDSGSCNAGIFLEFHYGVIDRQAGDNYDASDVSDAVEYFWSGAGNITIGQNLYKGLGRAGEVSGLSESGRTRINEVSFKLSNVPNNAVIDVKYTEVRGRKSKLRIGLLDSRRQLIGDLLPYSTVETDFMNVRVSSERENTITVIGHSGLVDLINPTQIAWTSEEQVLELADAGINERDVGFDRIPKLVNEQNFWRKGARR